MNSEWIATTQSSPYSGTEGEGLFTHLENPAAALFPTLPILLEGQICHSVVPQIACNHHKGA